MLKSFPRGGWKLPDLTTTPDELGPLPVPMQRAVRLMLAGAAATALWGIYVTILTAANTNYVIVSGGKKTAVTGAQLATSIVFAIAVTLILTAVWVLMARMSQRGRNWARITSTVLFLLWSYETFLSIGGATTNPAVIIELVAVVIIWAVGLGALFLLWRPESSAYFRASRDS